MTVGRLQHEPEVARPKGAHFPRKARNGPVQVATGVGADDHLGRPSAHNRLDDGHDEGLPIPEVNVEGATREPGARADRVEAGAVDAIVPKRVHCGRQQGLPRPRLGRCPH